MTIQFTISEALTYGLEHIQEPDRPFFLGLIAIMAVTDRSLPDVIIDKIMNSRQRPGRLLLKLHRTTDRHGPGHGGDADFARHRPTRAKRISHASGNSPAFHPGIHRGENHFTDSIVLGRHPAAHRGRDSSGLHVPLCGVSHD